MSWFQSTNLATFAKSALKEAQKTIDKALDISEVEGGTVNNTTTSSDRVAAVTEAASDFFASWGVAVGTKKGVQESDSSAEQKPKPPSPLLNSRRQSLQSSSTLLSATSTNLAHATTNQPQPQQQHKRASSLETSQGPWSTSSSLESSTVNVMHKSLTSDIPVTLLASFDNEPPSENGEGVHHHTRSLSDTIFHSTSANLINTFDGQVQVLDDVDASSNFNFIHSESTSESLQLPLPLIPQPLQSTSVSNVRDSQLVPTIVSKNHPIESALSGEETSAYVQTTSTVLKTVKTYVDSTVGDAVDLTNVPLNSSDVELIPTSSNVELSSKVINHTEDSFCDNSWNWTDSEIQSEEWSVKTNEINSYQSDQNKNDESHTTSPNLPVADCGSILKTDVILSDISSSNDAVEIDTQKETCDKVDDANFLEDSSSTLVASEEKSKSSEDDDAWTSQVHEEETSQCVTHPSPLNECQDGNVEGLASPKAPSSSISVIDSPRSSSSMNGANQSESPRESPTDNNSPFDFLCGSISADPQEHKCADPEQITEELPQSCEQVGSCQQQDPESSRSSSVVVISSCRNSTPSSSGGSTGSDGHQDIEDHSHSSNNFDNIEPGARKLSNTSTNEFVPPTASLLKGQHKKGLSSASSSDIEVIYSEYVKRGGDENYSSKMQQTHEIELEEKETQTDIPSEFDESKLLEKELPKKLTLEISEMLSEKDQMIDQLREEGEKLSKKQFDLSQIVKKLRAKEKESENTIKGLKGELAGKTLENERLTKSFVNKETLEHSQNQNISKLNSEKRKLELKIEEMRSEVEDANENCASMKASLEDASIEILELKNAISSAQRDSAELDSLTREKSELISRNESLQKEVDHLRSSINSSQLKFSSRECELQSQIGKLTEKIHMLEHQVSDVSSEMADATMPLSLEIEKLQTQLQRANLQHEKRESVLLAQISEIDLKLKSSAEREKSFKDLTQSLQSSVSNFELKIQELENENKSLKKGFSESTLNSEQLATDQKLKLSKCESQIQRLIEEVERLTKENDMLGVELKCEKNVIEQERKKSQSLMDQLVGFSGGNRNSQLYQQQNHQRTNSMSGLTATNNNANLPKSGENSPSSNSVISEVSYLDEVFDPHGHLVNNQRSMTPKSFFESFSSVGLIENLQSQLRQRETEVMQFQEEVSKNEKIRKSLNEEIAKLTMQNQEFLVEMETLAHLKLRLEELEKNYNALLQMYGEKVEEADELRMDLQDVKEMYKVQIEQLVNK